MTLFQRGNFTLHSGDTSGFRIECDELTDDDLDTIAWMIAGRVPNFRWVEGVPTGGLRLAAALEPYQQSGGCNLIVDDVATTWRSMEEQRAGRSYCFGAVIFDRCSKLRPPWCKALFTLEGSADDF